MLNVVEQPATGLGPQTAPLLVEERDTAEGALVADRTDPVRVDRPVIASGFTAGDHPVDAVEVHRNERPEQRLGREEPDRGRDAPQVVQADELIRGLDRDAHPHVRRPRQERRAGVAAGATAW